MAKKHWIIGLILCISLHITPLFAEAYPSATLSVSSSVEQLKKGETATVYFDLALPSGWYTYSHLSKETGKPPTVSWTLDEGVEVSEMVFPKPTQIQGPSVWGYESEVRFQALVSVPDDIKGERLLIKGSFSWLQCNTVCIPLSQPFLLTIPYADVTVLSAESSSPRTERTLMWLIVFAFLGGLLLNIMPCVLPVLALKAMELAESQARNRLLQAFGVLLGVLLSMWGLVLVLVLLQKAGAELGWGFHLQSPYFVTFLIVLFVILALNLLGVFELGLFWTRFHTKKSKGASFLSAVVIGGLATLVSTPCSAPFMGVAIGAALSRAPLDVFLIFTVLGLGLVFPFFLIATVPSLDRLLPKPGKWMIRFKQMMAVLLGATVIWLLWVVSLQITSASLIRVLGMLIGTTVVWGLYGKLQRSGQSSKALWIFLILNFLCYAYIINTLSSTSSLQRSEQVQSVIQWESFSREKIRDYESNGTPYFLNFTAAWCVTCQVNKATTFSDLEVAKYLKEREIRAIKADWTQESPEISAELARYDRVSIPVYIYFDGVSAPQLLPEILTPTILKNNLGERKEKK